MGTFMMTQAISTIPVELDEAAVIDGCSDLGIFRHVILPLSKPALASVFIILFVNHWNNFIYPFIVTNKENMRTLTVALYFLAAGGDVTLWPPPWGIITVMITVMFVPVLVIFIAFQDYFHKGIALTGMK